MPRDTSVTLTNDLESAHERIRNLERSNASLVARYEVMAETVRVFEIENKALTEANRKAGLKEYAPVAFRSNRELMGMRQKARMPEIEHGDSGIKGHERLFHPEMIDRAKTDNIVLRDDFKKLLVSLRTGENKA